MSATRQHYSLATGKGLEKSPKGPNPGFAKGGKVGGKGKGGMPMKKTSGRGC